MLGVRHPRHDRRHRQVDGGAQHGRRTHALPPKRHPTARIKLIQRQRSDRVDPVIEAGLDEVAGRVARAVLVEPHRGRTQISEPSRCQHERPVRPRALPPEPVREQDHPVPIDLVRRTRQPAPTHDLVVHPLPRHSHQSPSDTHIGSLIGTDYLRHQQKNDDGVMPDQARPPRDRIPPEEVLLVRDFVNTVEWQEDKDSWAAPADLQRWFQDRAGIAVQVAGEEDLLLARGLREGLRSLLLRHAGHEPLPSAEDALDQALVRIPLRMQVGRGQQLRLHSSQPDSHPLAVVLQAVEASRISGDWERLKVCARDSCRWAYWDASRSRSGRWCSMAWCGNYVKMRTRNGDPLSPDELQPPLGETRPPRLVDVAARAGVSMKTVSNVVNNSAPVSATTRTRVEAVIRELDYRPNLAARALRNGHPHHTPLDSD